MLKEYCDICKREIKDNRNDKPECIRFNDEGCISLLDYDLPNRGICRDCHDKVIEFIKSISR